MLVIFMQEYAKEIKPVFISDDKVTPMDLTEKYTHEEKHYFQAGFYNNIDGFTKSPCFP